MAKKARRRRRRGTKKTTRRTTATRRNALGRVSLGDLERELQRRRKRREALEERREALAAEIESIDQELAGAAGTRRTLRTRATRRTRAGGRRRPAGTGRAKKVTRKATRKARKTPTRRPRRGRGGNKLSLPDALHAVMQNKTMGISEAMGAVQKAGYKTASPNFAKIVNRALADRRRFTRLGRGQYTAK